MDALHDDVPIVVVDVKIPMTPITPEISASVVYMDWMILILDETPSFDKQTAKQVQYAARKAKSAHITLSRGHH